MRKQAFNPYLPPYEYIPDAEPYEFGGRVYVYGSHDRFDAPMFCMNDYVCYSAPVTDLSDWRYEGVIYKKNQDPANKLGLRLLFAPDVTKGPDGRFYLYYAFDFMGIMGVAVADSPAGPYEFYGHVHYPDGTTWGRKKGDSFPFDPGVLVDDDGRVYLYSGFYIPIPAIVTGGKKLRFDGGYVLELEQDMVTIRRPEKLLFPKIGEGSFPGHEFFEASSIRKYDGLYYFVYSSKNNHELCYAVSSSPTEGFEYKGTLVSNADIGIDLGEDKEADRETDKEANRKADREADKEANRKADREADKEANRKAAREADKEANRKADREAEKETNGKADGKPGRESSGEVDARFHNYAGNNHGGMLRLGDDFYIFYHRQTNRNSYSRQTCAEKLRRRANGDFAQAEMTSCGLNGGPLAGKGIYEARIACSLSYRGEAGRYDGSSPKRKLKDHPYITQNRRDGHPSARQYIANMRDGAQAGFKYFDITRPTGITIQVRGRASGEMRVSTTEDFAEYISIPIELGMDSGIKPGNKIGTKSDSKIGTRPDSKIGTRFDSKIGTRSGRKIGTRSGSKIGTKSDSKIGTRSDSKIGTKFLSKIGSTISRNFNRKRTRCFKGELGGISGVCALYFRYLGEGSIDFLQFKLSPEAKIGLYRNIQEISPIFPDRN